MTPTELRAECERLHKLAHDAPLNPYRLDADGHRWVEQYSSAWARHSRAWMDACEKRDRQKAAALAQLDSADAREVWRKAGDVPLIKPGASQQYILAVYRKRSGKVYSFAAEYLNDYPLRYDWGCPKDHKGICDGCSEDGCPTTGWYVTEGADDDGYTYHALSLSDGDRIEGWREVPRWEDRSTGLLPDASPGNGAVTSSVVAKIEEARDLFWDIKGDFSDPRTECRRGADLLEEVLAALHSTTAAGETTSSDGAKPSTQVPEANAVDLADASKQPGSGASSSPDGHTSEAIPAASGGKHNGHHLR